MGIRDNSKKIIERILKQAVESGDIRVAINVSYDELAVDLDVKTANYCKVCLQYLEQKKLIQIEPGENSNLIFLTANVSAIDFFEA